MRKRILKHPFNMVEIALAMAIIAIGLSSILVLFPVGVNANKSAVADNNLADVAEYMIGYLRAGCASEWRNRAGNPSASLFFSGGLSSSRPGNTGDGTEACPDTPTDGSWTSAGMDTGGTRLYKHSGGSGVFLFQQVTILPDSTVVSDFSAVIRLWKEAIDFYVPQVSTGNWVDLGTANTAEKNELNNYYGKALCLEISYPAEVPYANREKRYFRYEIFNESFKRSDGSGGE